MILLLGLLVKSCVVVCDAEFSALVSVMCLYSAMPKLVHEFFCWWLFKSRLVMALHIPSLNY